MTESPTPHPALTELTSGATALEKLDRLCCEPGRSPRMRALAETLEDARNAVSLDPDAALVHLEDAGAQVGSLQVGCCTEARMPLYATLLESLTKAELSINWELGRGH